MTETAPAPRRPYHRIDTQLTPEVGQVLGRYLEIQRLQQELQEEKARLQQSLTAFLAREQDGMWYPTVAGTPLKVRYARESVVEYDEVALRQRLGDRYVHVLRPDPRKIRQNLAALEPLLAPKLADIGTPDRDRVRGAIERGLVRADEFAGAFRKSQRVKIAVMRALPADLEAAGAPGEVQP